MKSGIFIVVLLVFLFLFSFGCTKPGKEDATSDIKSAGSESQPETINPEPNFPEQVYTEESFTWQTYSNMGVSFDYPVGMGIQEDATKIDNETKRGYGNAWLGFQDRSVIIFVGYINTGEDKSSFNTSEDLAYDSMGKISKSEELPFIKDSNEISEIRKFTADKGAGAADMDFKFLAEDTSQQFGSSIDFADKGGAELTVLISTKDQKLTRVIHDRIVKSFSFGS